MMDSMLELVDLGDAKRETKQLYAAIVHRDHMFGWGIYPDGI